MNTHFCFIWLFKLGRQGRIIPKIQLCLESILNLPQIQKTLAIWVRRWTHTLCFLPFPLQMATQCWHEFHGTAKTQFIWWEQWTPPSFTWSKSKECDQGLRLLPSFVPIGFFWFAFYFKVMILWTAPTLCKLEQEHIGSEGSVCCGGECEPGDVFGCGCRKTPVAFQPGPLHSVHTERAG